MKSFTSVLLIAFLSLLATRHVSAQPGQDLIPGIESAESVFATAVQAYDDQQFDVAERLFGVVALNYPFHKKTTAALLMQGKSLYQMQRYQEAIDVLTSLKSNYPTSTYSAEADRLIEFARQGTENAIYEARTFKLGIALPLSSDTSIPSQQLFNGIRMAVDAHNNAPADPSTGRLEVQMFFRDTQNTPQQAREAIRNLVEADRVDAIIGPLFSTEALAAAQEADRAGVVMIAPLATDEGVAGNRAFVFQANPTLEVRGKLMARLAVRGLGIESIGVITDYANPESLGMVRGFQRELSEQNIELIYQYFLNNTRTWFRLSDEISRDTLLQVEALYLPINGGNASTLIGGALGSLDRMGLGSRIRVVGNKEWHNTPNVSLASKYSVSYTNDFYVSEDDSLAADFLARYVNSYGEEPTRLSYSGYDVTTFLTNQLGRVAASPDYPLYRILQEAGLFQGLGNRIDFSSSNVNEAMYYHRYRDGASELLR